MSRSWSRLRRQGRCGPLSAHHLLLIALVLRLRVSPWSLMHVRNNVFTCSSCIIHGQGEGYSVVEDPLPTGPVFSLCMCVYVCLSVCMSVCVSWFTFSQAVKSIRYQAQLQEAMEHQTTNNNSCTFTQAANWIDCQTEDARSQCHQEAVGHLVS